MNISYYKDIYNLLSKRHPNKKIYVISDHHFYHNNIIKYQRQNFQSVIEMNEYIINKHNSFIQPDDIVLFLGDFSFKKSELKNLLTRMNGYKYLLLGNHDNESIINCYGDLGLEGIFTNPVKIKNKFLSHYPLRDNEVDDINFKLLIQEFQNSNGINFHGHLHNNNIESSSFVNVCCEVRNYKPLLIDCTQETILDSKPLIINSNEFEQILKYLEKEKQINPSLIISDYIYALLLESISSYYKSFFVYGSYPLYKKYGFTSCFSDLDISLIYDENISKTQNRLYLKQIFDTAFEEAKNIDNLNLSMIKRIANMCIFKILYANNSGNIYSGYCDTNFIPIDIYCDTDFITTAGCSTLENILRNESSLIDDFRFPKYEVKFLTIDGDIANTLLQLLFQKDFNGKKALILKKLKYICRIYNNDVCDINNFENIFTRFFIRNIMFFHTTRRKEEIDYINGLSSLNSFIEQIPFSLKSQAEEILKNPTSLFNMIYKELLSVNFEEIPTKSKELIKSIKQ